MAFKASCNLALSTAVSLNNPIPISLCFSHSGQLDNPWTTRSILTLGSLICFSASSYGSSPYHLSGLCSNVTFSEEPSLTTCHSLWPLSLSIPLSWFFLPSIFYLTSSTPPKDLFQEGRCSVLSLKQWSPTFLAPETSFVEDSFTTDKVGWFGNDSSMLHSLRTWFLLLLHELQLRSSGIRSQRLGTPALHDFHSTPCLADD